MNTIILLATIPLSIYIALQLIKLIMFVILGTGDKLKRRVGE